MDAEVRIGVRAVGRASVRFTRPTSTSEAAPQGEASPTDLIPVSFRCSSRSSARPPRLQVPQRQGRVAKGASISTSARGPCPQVLQWHPRVAKRASIGTLARRPSTEALLGQGRVAKGRESVPLTGLWSSLQPGSARHSRLQIVLRHPRVAKRAPIGTLARRPSTEALLGQGRVAKGIGTVDGIMVGFTTVFGTSPPATDSSEVSSRGEGGFYQHFCTTTLN